MHPDSYPYFRYTTKSRLDKAVQTLVGIIKGITIDSAINNREVAFLADWVKQCDDVRHKHPFNELVPVVEEALRDGVLIGEEAADILWLCDKLSETSGFYDRATNDMQQLHGILCGILADGNVTEGELKGLSEWLDEHDHLKTIWPYDEIASIITAVMSDGKIDGAEQKMLQALFCEFVKIDDDATITNPAIIEGEAVCGLCAVCPEITFESACFCFTGTSSRYRRDDLRAVVEGLGGKFTNNVSKSVDFLIIGADGNPCWAYACYGRKVEAAVNLRKQGHKILLVHENDFHDAVSDVAG